MSENATFPDSQKTVLYGKPLKYSKNKFNNATTEIPDILKYVISVIDPDNSQKLNSIVINKYSGEDSVRTWDRYYESSIKPESSTFCLFIGGQFDIVFRDAVKLTSASGDKKKMWKIINSLRGLKKQSLSSTFNIDNVNVSCRKRIANAFNKHFSSLAKNLNKDIDLNNESIPNFRTYLPKHQQYSFFLAETSSKEIIDIIKEFKNGKSSDIPIIVIKHIKQIIAPYLSKFINACISIGTFPSSLKLGKITPNHKKGPKNEVSNYRPVSTLPIFGKIFEKIIYSRLYSFLTDHNILSNTQFGFRKHHSTSYAVNYSVNLIKQFQYEGKSTIGVFIDLSKAFDTIDHTTLLSKLECYGIRGIAHDLLRSYLSNRYQLINIDGTHSDKELVSYGVPQGSVLGPLLFLI